MRSRNIKQLEAKKMLFCKIVTQIYVSSISKSAIFIFKQFFIKFIKKAWMWPIWPVCNKGERSFPCWLTRWQLAAPSIGPQLRQKNLAKTLSLLESCWCFLDSDLVKPHTVPPRDIPPPPLTSFQQNQNKLLQTVTSLCYDTYIGKIIWKQYNG